MSIFKELDLFWRWANMDETKYSLYECSSKPFDEYDYPNWNKLVAYAKLVLLKQNDQKIIYSALTVMGLDNESEEVLSFCKTLSISRKIKIAKIGLKHIQAETRWQIADLLGDLYLIEAYKISQILANDSNLYVRKRANNSLEKLKIKLGL